MRFHRPAAFVLALVTVVLSASCATTKSVGDNIQRVYNHQSVDKAGLSDAMASDTKDMKANLVVVQHKIAAAYALLKTNVRNLGRQNDTKVAISHGFVKYTQGYKSRVITVPTTAP